MSESIASILSLAGTMRNSMCKTWFQGLYGWRLSRENERRS
ncbi:hypothetical protein [Halomonas korlensis]|nr:hypothetical protein [Halomonas korlensis]